MNEERLHQHRNRRIAEVSELIRQRDREVEKRGAASERLARRIIVADAEVAEIERELHARGR